MDIGSSSSVLSGINRSSVEVSVREGVEGWTSEECWTREEGTSVKEERVADEEVEMAGKSWLVLFSSTPAPDPDSMVQE